MIYKVQTQQPVNIVQEYEIRAESESEAIEKIEMMMSDGTLPDPVYTATEKVSTPEVFSVTEL
jgi:hypothetical protein